MNTEEKDWDEEPDLWEHQGRGLTAEWLRVALDSAGDPSLPIEIVFFDGRDRHTLTPMEIGFTGHGRRPTAIVITVTRPQPTND